MDLRDVSSRKTDNNRISLVGLVWRNKDIRTSRFGLCKRLCEIRHLISRHLPAVGVWKVTVSNERSQLPELRFNPHSSVGFCRSSDFNPWGSRFIRDNTSVTEGNKAAHERIRAVR